MIYRDQPGRVPKRGSWDETGKKITGPGERLGSLTIGL